MEGMSVASASRATGYASVADLDVCRRLHRKHGTTYYFSTQLFPRAIRNRTHALYGFVRTADELVDNPTGDFNSAEEGLQSFQLAYERGMLGSKPNCPVLRAFCDLVDDRKIPNREPQLFLEAMAMDLSKTRYETYAELEGYMRGSAAAVGVMMCYLMCDQPSEQCLAHATALGQAMQLTNFLRDIQEDWQRNRIYIPLEDLRRFGVTESEFGDGKVTQQFRELMQFEIARARDLYQFADRGIDCLPKEGRKSVRLASRLYSRILNRIEDSDYDVFRTRARTSGCEKLTTAVRILLATTG